MFRKRSIKRYTTVPLIIVEVIKYVLDVKSKYDCSLCKQNKYILIWLKRYTT